MLVSSKIKYTQNIRLKKKNTKQLEVLLTAKKLQQIVGGGERYIRTPHKAVFYEVFRISCVCELINGILQRLVYC